MFSRLTTQEKLAIAKRVRALYDDSNRWFQANWGKDDRGYELAVEEERMVVYDDDFPEVQTPSLEGGADSVMCLCLGAAIKIETARMVGGNPGASTLHSEAMCSVYCEAGGLSLLPKSYDKDLHLDFSFRVIVDWNDDEDRTFDEVVELADKTVAYLEAQAA